MPVQIRHVEPSHNGVFVQTTNNRYVFPFLKGDEIRGGKKKDLEGKVTYGGDGSLSKHYVTSHDFDEVPDAVLDAVREYATIVDDVDGGWASWDGRPEFSTSYVDISDATEV